MGFFPPPLLYKFIRGKNVWSQRTNFCPEDFPVPALTVTVVPGSDCNGAWPWCDFVLSILQCLEISTLISTNVLDCCLVAGNLWVRFCHSNTMLKAILCNGLCQIWCYVILWHLTVITLFSECIELNGTSYKGVQLTSSSGQSCLNWLDVSNVYNLSIDLNADRGKWLLLLYSSLVH